MPTRNQVVAFHIRTESQTKVRRAHEYILCSTRVTPFEISRFVLCPIESRTTIHPNDNSGTSTTPFHVRMQAKSMPEATQCSPSWCTTVHTMSLHHFWWKICVTLNNSKLGSSARARLKAEDRRFCMSECRIHYSPGLLSCIYPHPYLTMHKSMSEELKKTRYGCAAGLGVHIAWILQPSNLLSNTTVGPCWNPRNSQVQHGLTLTTKLRMKSVTCDYFDQDTKGQGTLPVRPHYSLHLREFITTIHSHASALEPLWRR